MERKIIKGEKKVGKETAIVKSRGFFLGWSTSSGLPRCSVGQGAPQAINACMYGCPRGHYEGLSRCRLVGSCVLPGEFSLHSPTCKTTFARLTQSQEISQSFCVFITFGSMRDTTFFSFSKLFLIQNYRLLYHCDQHISWPMWRICRWRAVNFEINLCSSDMKSDCIWQSIISSMSK